ncbi:MAG: hypothetical protein J7L57_02645 [Deltaproteobacteria bacterium]|nr:hypothetical protein [Candidatus Tharpella sp.]
MNTSQERRQSQAFFDFFFQDSELGLSTIFLNNYLDITLQNMSTLNPTKSVQV